MGGLCCAERGSRGGGESNRETDRTPLNVTQEEGFRDEDDVFYDAVSTPQGGREVRLEAAATGGGAAPAATPPAAPPATAASVTDKRPDGVCAAIQKEVDEGGGGSVD